MGAYVGRIGLKDGKGVMTSWRYVDGAKYLPADAEVKKLRPATEPSPDRAWFPHGAPARTPR